MGRSPYTRELVGMSFLTDDVPLSLKCGVTRLPVGKAGCSGPGSIDWKLLDALEGINSEMFLSLALLFQLKMRR